MEIETLKYKVNAETGELIVPQKRGLIDMIRDGGREYVYMTGSFGMSEFKRLVKSMNPFHYFDGLFENEHFEPMPDFDTASMLDKKLYLIARESEIRTLKRLRAYVGMEQDFYLNN